MKDFHWKKNLIQTILWPESIVLPFDYRLDTFPGTLTLCLLYSIILLKHIFTHLNTPLAQSAFCGIWLTHSYSYIKIDQCL